MESLDFPSEFLSVDEIDALQDFAPIADAFFKDLEDHTCQECGKSFTAKKNLTRHLKIHQENRETYPCVICHKDFSRNEHLIHHNKSVHERKEAYFCSRCDKVSSTMSEFLNHQQTHENEPSTSGLQTGGRKRKINTSQKKSPTNPITNKRTPKDKNCVEALNVFKVKTFPPTDETADLDSFLAECKQNIVEELNSELLVQNALKFYLCVEIKFVRKISEEENEYMQSFFRSNNKIILTSETIEESVEMAYAKVKDSLDEFQAQGSNWIIDSILKLELKTARYHPLAASSYIATPKVLADKKAILNIQNNDQRCFIWSVLAAIHPVDREKQPHRVNHYTPYETELNLEGIEFPMKLSQVNKFERQNNISVNIFGFSKEVFPLKITEERFEKHVNLLLISDGEKQHFCLIRNLSRLLGNLTKHDPRSYYCNYCLHRYSEERSLKEHIVHCKEHGAQKIEMPKPNNNILKFENYRFQLKMPYVVYADFESILVEEGAETTSNTEILNKHIPCGYCYIVVGPDGKSFGEPVLYRGRNAVNHFWNSILKTEDEIKSRMNNIYPIDMSKTDEENFQNATHCHICNKILGSDRVRDHDHLKPNNNFVGAAHNACNLNYKLTKKIGIVFHNLKNYDGSLLMEGIGKIKDRKIDCIPNNMEKYISFSLGDLQFIDSLQFLNASLQTLVDILDKDKFNILRSHSDPNTVDLLLRKGVYCYEYMSSFDKFEETELPPRSAFNSTLTGECISEEDYLHAQKVWKAFQIKNIGEYHDVYLKTDVLLLADVFENFRTLCMESYKIDPCHTMTAPGLSWQACLKMTDVRLELITDPDIHLFIERGIRGGVSMISHRYAKANNKYLEDYDAQDEENYILYLDANNLYGWAMIQHLPVGEFSWVAPNTFSEDDILKMSDDAEFGFIFEVDLEYPEHLHDQHNDYPLAPERVTIFSDQFSNYLKDNFDTLPSKIEKLIPNLNDKKNYILHFRNLKLYLNLGLKLQRIHKVLQFKQSPWLQPYIELNTCKRKQAKNEFEKNFFKLMNNAVFGKTMENLRNRVKVELVQTEKRAKKIIASPAFESFRIFNEDLVGVQSKKTCLVLNRPIYVGFTILDVSKTLMFNFHYNVMKRQYGSNVSLLFTDTDSFCYQVKTTDVYEDMKQNLNQFDTSDYPKTHFLYSEVNKKVLGKMKDELAGAIASEFVGLRPKMYSLKSGDVEKKTAKGVNRCLIKNKIRHEDFKTCLFNKVIQKEDMVRIRTLKHVLQTIRTTKVSLSPMDDKRYILDDGISTLAYGHYKIKGFTS